MREFLDEKMNEKNDYENQDSNGKWTEKMRKKTRIFSLKIWHDFCDFLGWVRLLLQWVRLFTERD